MSDAFADLGYREDGPEEVEPVPGSETSEAYRARLAQRPASVAHIRATSAGDAALARIREVLHGKAAPRAGRQAGAGRPVGVTPDAYWSAVSRVVRGCA